jgi:HAE1 family hydrophobic/amphiphilic exporter-1
MVMVAITVLGLVSFSRLAIEQFPDVDFPGRGGGRVLSRGEPGGVEADIVEPVEQAVATIAGDRHIQPRRARGRRWC